METTELLLAAEVRKLAAQIRDNRWIAFINASNIRKEGNKDSLQFHKMKARWETEHPIAHYIPHATAQLKNVALQLKAIIKDD